MDDLKNIAPELTKISKENNFSIPENYFEDLPSKIQQQVSQADKQTDFIIQLLKRPAFTLSFSTLLIVFIVVLFTVSHFRNRAHQTQIAYQNFELSDLDYFGIDEDMLIEEINIDNLETTQSENDEYEEAVLDYINDNVDYSTILDEI